MWRPHFSHMSAIEFFVSFVFLSHSHFPFFPKGGGGALLREKMVEVGVNSDPN